MIKQKQIKDVDLIKTQHFTNLRHGIAIISITQHPRFNIDLKKIGTVVLMKEAGFCTIWKNIGNLRTKHRIYGESIKLWSDPPPLSQNKKQKKRKKKRETGKDLVLLNGIKEFYSGGSFQTSTAPFINCLFYFTSLIPHVLGATLNGEIWCELLRKLILIRL